MPAPARGQRVADLFGSYQKMPPGPRKRAMASRILVANEALIQATVDCLCGRKPLAGLRRPFRGCEGFDRLEMDDAMQAGRIAFSKAIDQYDPSRGKFPYYLLMKTRNELHNIETWGFHLLHVPEAHVQALRPSRQIHLFGAFRELESGDDNESVREGGPALKDLSLSHLGDLVDIDEFTPEDVEEWTRTGEWPEDLESWQASKETAPSFVPIADDEPELSGWERFLAHCRFIHVGRTPTFDAHNRYRLDCRAAGDDELGRVAFVDELSEKFGVREVKIRTQTQSSVRALAGVAVSAA